MLNHGRTRKGRDNEGLIRVSREAYRKFHKRKSPPPSVPSRAGEPGASHPKFLPPLPPTRHLPESTERCEKGDMTGTYQTLTVDLPDGDMEAAQDVLHEVGVLGLEVRDREGPTMPGVRAPAPGEAILVAYFDDAETAEAARAQLAESFPSARLQLAEEAQQDWSNAWKVHIKSVQVGRLWVGPPWEAANAPADRVRLVIEPKMAFGTGDHPTTSLCLGAVDDYMATHPGASVLDVGTGTGVLAIAAKKLG